MKSRPLPFPNSLAATAVFLLCLGGIAEAAPPEEAVNEDPKPTKTKFEVPEGREVATLGTGCFWCTEAVFERIKGVEDVTSGYMGGEKPNPTYKEVCSGKSGHAEVVQIIFDPEVISFEDLLAWFWVSHDPTTLNRQGADVGTQYRSAIFYHSDAQKAAAEKSKKIADGSGEFDDPIVTEITSASTYYKAEEYHQDYYRINPTQGYCRVVIEPKLMKLNPKEQPNIGME